jgi:hypothetical protein
LRLINPDDYTRPNQHNEIITCISIPVLTLDKAIELVPKLRLGNSVLEALASSLAKLELRHLGSQAGAWEPAQGRRQDQAIKGGEG